MRMEFKIKHREIWESTNAEETVWIIKNGPLYQVELIDGSLSDLYQTFEEARRWAECLVPFEVKCGFSLVDRERGATIYQGDQI